MLREKSSRKVHEVNEAHPTLAASEKAGCTLLNTPLNKV